MPDMQCLRLRKNIVHAFKYVIYGFLTKSLRNLKNIFGNEIKKLPQSWSQRTHVWSRKKPKAIGPGIDPMILAMQTCNKY